MDEPLPPRVNIGEEKYAAAFLARPSTFKFLKVWPAEPLGVIEDYMDEIIVAAENSSLKRFYRSVRRNDEYRKEFRTLYSRINEALSKAGVMLIHTRNAEFDQLAVPSSDPSVLAQRLEEASQNYKEAVAQYLESRGVNPELANPKLFDLNYIL